VLAAIQSSTKAEPGIAETPPAGTRAIFIELNSLWGLPSPVLAAPAEIS